MTSERALPVLRVRRGRMPDGSRSGGAFGLAPSSWSAPADKVGMDALQSVIYLATRVGDVRQAKDRHKTLLGRIRNNLTGEETEYVILPGNVLITVLKAVQSSPDWLEASGEYELRRDVAEELCERFKDVLRQNGAIQ